MGMALLQGLRAGGTMAMTAAALAVSASVAAANPPHPPYVITSLRQLGQLPTTVPASGDADLQLYLSATGQPVSSGTLQLLAPTGTEFDPAPGPSIPATPGCTAQTPTTYVCDLNNVYLPNGMTVDIPLRSVDTSMTPSGGTATFSPSWQGAAPRTIPLNVVFGAPSPPVEAAPMISGPVAAVCEPMAVLGAFVYVRRRRAAL